jgi:FdhD protein
MTSGVGPVLVRRVTAEGVQPGEPDLVAVEEPLEIRVEGRPTAVTMRTPGHDLDLVAGFLFTEGVIDGLDDLHALAHVDDPGDLQGNTVDTILASGVPAARRDRAQRDLFASSSCGICGKASIDRIFQSWTPLPTRAPPDPGVVLSLPGRLRAAQALFDATGGLHAAALFHENGELDVIREDVGRHNAVDKVVGHRLREDRVPCDETILLISGRASFEIVQKALVARVPVVAAIGAPTSLAVSLAARAGMILIGFMRRDVYNVYDGAG